MVQAPNPRLQRTPLRAPLSRKPLGGRGQLFMEVILIGFLALGGVVLVWALVSQQHSREELDRERRIAELNRSAAKEGRLRSSKYSL